LGKDRILEIKRGSTKISFSGELRKADDVMTMMMRRRIMTTTMPSQTTTTPPSSGRDATYV